MFARVMAIKSERNSKSEKTKPDSNTSSLKTCISSSKTISNAAIFPATIYFNIE